MNLPFFIAKRIYSDQGDKRKVSRPAIRIATIGVAIGLAVMIVTVSVVLGFKHTIRDKVVGFGSHIQVQNMLTFLSTDSYPILINDSVMRSYEQIEGVKHVERYTYSQGILKTDDDFLGVVFKGVGPEYDMDFLSQHLTEGEIPVFSDTASTNKILVSKMIADKLRLKAGDRIAEPAHLHEARAEREIQPRPETEAHQRRTPHPSGDGGNDLFEADA